MFKPDVPTIIVRHRELSYQEKAFLLWCWAVRESDQMCALISKRQNCAVRGRTIQWYADFFGIRRPNMSRMWHNLIERRILKSANLDSRNEVIYVDFTVFC